jgi:Rhodopirellula transposase DDE domain
VAIAVDAEAGLAAKFAVMRELLDERQWRVYLGTEARALGRGGVAAVARAAGASQVTVAAGAAQAADPDVLAALARGRSRRPGAGRPKAEDAQPGLRQALEGVLEEATRGDPVSEITWCSLSLRDLCRQLAARGFRCGKDAIARMLRQEGYSLQAMAKVLEGRQHPDRDGQFRHVNAMIRAFRAAGYPVVSADAKKKEQLGPYHRDGRAWRPAGDPVKVRDHDFPDQELGKITPYGVYDIAADRGFVSVGTSCDTAAFAVNALRLWWQQDGALRYPGATRLLVTADAGGSNGYRCRLWKDQLAVLAAETGLKISVVHFPPGTSKWNRIEHRLFCHITRTWRARPLMTADDAVAGIAATVTSQGLKCTAVRDDAAYPEGTKVSGDRLRYLQDRVVVRHGPHRDWNYTILPAPRPAPEPGPEPAPGRAGPDPALVRALAALAGIGDPDELAGELALAWDAAREHRLTLERGRGRIRRCGNSNASLARLALPAILTAAACRYNAGMSCALIGTLLGVHHATIGDATRYARPVLEQHGLTITTGRPRISTLRDLREHASATGITIPVPQPHPPPSRTRPPPAPDTPEPANLKPDASMRGATTRNHGAG